MIQYKKILMTLALLLTAVTGAWATVYSGQVSRESLQVGDILVKGAEVTSETPNYGLYGGSYKLNGSISSGLANVKKNLPVIGDDGLILVSTVNFTPYDADNDRNGNAWKVVETGNQNYGVILAGTTYVASITVEPGSSANTWTFTQPGSDVVLTPIYAPTAAWAEVESVKQLPAAAEGVIAGTDAPLIAEGTGIVATTMIGETPTAQGTVMYYVGTSAPTIGSDDWTEDVPTAKGYDDAATVTVWYYIQGADAPATVAATLDNTFNDSEVSSLNVTVLSNKFDLAFKAANANTIDATQASKGTVSVKVGDAAAVDKTKAIADGKLKAVKMGSEVKLNTKAGYKFRKVEVKKAVKTIKIGDQNYTVLDGETWILFIIRNKLSDWSIERYDNTTWRVSKNTGSSILTLLVSTDGNNWEPLKLTSDEAPIDTDKQYSLGIVN